MNFFTTDARKAAFVVIDMQNFSCVPVDGKRMPGIAAVIERINRLADICREGGVPVIWVRQNITSIGDTDDGGFYRLFHDEERTRGVMNRGKGTEIYREMDVDGSRDYIVFKNRYSAFLSKPPELQDKLKALGRTQLLIAGIAANVCVESTIRDAMQLDYEVILVSDGTTAPDDGALKNTLTNTRLFFGDVRTTDEIAASLMKNSSKVVETMKKIGISTTADIEAFFQAYNERDYDALFEKYMAEDCLWHASERALKGKREILDYWTKSHSAFKEILGRPENVVFGDGRVYLQVKIRLDFVEDGSFYGRYYKKGDVCHFGCADYYEFDAVDKIRLGLVYLKCFN